MENCNLNNSLESDSDSDSGSFLVLGRRVNSFLLKTTRLTVGEKILITCRCQHQR